MQFELAVDPAKTQMAEAAIQQLRQLQAGAARDTFARMLQSDTGAPLIRAAYSEALLLLGFDKKARQEAQLAVKQVDQADAQGKLLVQGIAYETGGKCAEAVEAYGKLNAEEADNIVRLARAQLQCGLAKESVETLRGAQSRGLKDARLSLAEAESLAAMRDYTAQHDAANAAIAAGESAVFIVSRARLLQADAQAHLGETENARTTLTNLLQSPEASQDPLLRALPHMVLGKVYILQNNPAEAEKEYQLCRKVLDEIGNERYLPEALLGLGNTAMAQKDAAAARSHFSAALQLVPSASVVRGQVELGLGLALAALQETGAAKPHLESALKSARAIQDKEGTAAALSGLASLPGRPGRRKNVQ